MSYLSCCKIPKKPSLTKHQTKLLTILKHQDTRCRQDLFLISLLLGKTNEINQQLNTHPTKQSNPVMQKIASTLIVGDYILSCDKIHVKGKVKKVNVFYHQTANPWSDTNKQNAANWAGALIRARSPIGSSRKQVLSVVPPDRKEARAAADDVEKTYNETNSTVTIITTFGTYSIPGDTVCYTMEMATVS